ncbi:MAG: hypothetical protein AAF471_06945, partial [Myxococcota bacterium]
LEQSAQAALRQIKHKRYAAEFAQRPERRDAINRVSTGEKKQVIALGPAFAGKRLAAAHERVG